MTRSLPCWLLAVQLVAALGCHPSPPLAPRLSELSTQIAELRQRGAVDCAPRHMAMALSHREFAAVEMEQGFFDRAAVHFWIAQRQLTAASLMLGMTRCGEPFSDEVSSLQGRSENRGSVVGL